MLRRWCIPLLANEATRRSHGGRIQQSDARRGRTGAGQACAGLLEPTPFDGQQSYVLAGALILLLLLCALSQDFRGSVPATPVPANLERKSP